MKILTAVVLLASLTQSALAWDTSKNPDRFLSLGLNIDSDKIDGGYGPKINEDNYLKVGENVTKTTTVEFDVRWPITNRLTLSGRVRGLSMDDRFNSAYPDVLDSTIFDGSGSGFGVGLRFYFVR